VTTIHPDMHEVFRQNLRHELTYRSWTVAELCRRAHVNASTLRTFMNRHTDAITLDMAHWIALALDVPLDKMLAPRSAVARRI
jgi:transcriptional regulator with XRE-family HTH domain